MKRVTTTFLLLIIGSYITFAYDFSAIAPSGQNLYYTITSESTVEVIAPGSDNNWAGYDQPTGSLIIPSTVLYLNKKYNVTSIGNYAFQYCSGLISVSIPSSIVEIGNWAFSSSGVETIIYPSTPILLGGWVFAGTPWLRNQPEGLVYLGNTLYWYKGVLPENYSLTIPSNVNSIAGRAFNYGYEAGQINLVNVQIPSSVKFIGPNAFYKCHLNTLSLPEEIEIIGDYAFGYNYFSEASIPSSVKYLGHAAFGNCASLTTVHYNAQSAQGSDFYVSPSVFVNSANLTTFNWGTNIQQIPSGLLNGCSGLIGNLNIPSTVTQIGKYAFYGCTGFTGNLTIPSTITEVGEYAFSGCSGLTTMSVDATNIGKFAFSNCANVTQLTIGENVDSVGNLSFTSLPKIVTLFYNARNLHSENSGISYTSLSSLFFGDKVQHLPDYFMQTSTNLTAVSFPNSLVSIGKYTFTNTTGLSGDLVIPEKVKSIGSFSFWYCFNISCIKSLSTIPPSIDATVFSNMRNKTLYVPGYSLSDYQSAPGWSLFQNISAIDEYNDIKSTSISGDNINIYLHDGQIVVDGTSDEVKIFDMVGRNVQDKELPIGVYIVRIGNSFARKVVVK